MFNKDELNRWLEGIGKHVDKSVDIYMIGGGALSFEGFKELTKDIDLICNL
jgi:hypothetical protein